MRRMIVTLLLLLVSCANAGDVPRFEQDIWGDTPVIEVTCITTSGEVEEKHRLLWGTFKSTDEYQQCELEWQRPEDEE